MKWFKRIVVALIAIPILAVGVLYIWSEVILDREYRFESRSIALSSNPEVIARGERLSRVLGCFHGCHGANMEGSVFFEEDWVGRFVAPNLTKAVDRYSPAELEAIIRQGVLPDGISVLGMPSESFAIMTDEDLVAVLSFIQTYPPSENDPGKSKPGPLARLGLVMGQYLPAAAAISEAVPWQEGFRNDPGQLGAYVATVTCAECHGLDFEGQEGFTPPLTIAKAYSLDDFRTLMAEGIGLGGRDLGLMSGVARTRFRHFTDDEVEALHDYLHSR